MYWPTSFNLYLGGEANQSMKPLLRIPAIASSIGLFDGHTQAL